MDGTLVDTEPHWMAAEVSLMTEHGVAWSHHDAEAMIGMPLLTAAEHFRSCGVDLPADQVVAHLLGSVVAAVVDEAPWQPGAIELLDALAGAGVPCALVTMSYRELAEAVTAHAPGAFAVVVPGDEVTHGKPHPEPYLRAAAALGVPIRECLAIEDSPPGIASALSSGARTVGVQHIVPVSAQPGLSRVSSLTELDLDQVVRIMAGATIDTLG